MSRLVVSEVVSVLGCLGDGGVFDRSKVEVEVVWALSKVVANRKTWCWRVVGMCCNLRHWW